jgi:undecaprenyl-diphosphatase
MHILQAVLMGIVQGLSEFLPISSSGHLVFTSNFYRLIKGAEALIHSNQEVFLDIMLHLGTLIAVLIFFRKEIFSIITSTCKAIKNKKFETIESKMGVYIISGTVITIAVAYPLNNFAASLVFKPSYVAVLLILTGFLLIFSENFAKKIQEKKEINLKRAILIGLAQGLAALPGLSRSGLTIATGLLSGMSREQAAKYSFLLSIPIILGASMVYPFVEFEMKEIAYYNWVAIIIGTIVSAIVGYLCIKYFIKFVSKFSLSVFGYYCIIMGVVVLYFFLGR